jgi:hypothetical protein
MITANGDILQDICVVPELKIPSSSGSKRKNEDVWAKIKRTGLVVKKVTAAQAKTIKLEPVGSPEYLEETEDFEASDQDPDQDWYDDQDSKDSDFQPPGKRQRKSIEKPVAKKNEKVEYIREIILDESSAYTCHKCKAGYSSMGDLYQHMKTGRCFEVELKCEVCDKVFDNKR